MPIANKDIPYVREDRLHKEMSFLSYKRDQLLRQIRKERKDEILAERLHSMETDICYIFRELERRAARKVAHQKFMQKKNAKRSHFKRDNRANRNKNSV
tara:strand:- start:8664 stop:8960 length:297 start_codon:yes stop_codon:yes gene_type:complete